MKKKARKPKMKCNDIENEQKIQGYEVTVFIEDTNYLALKEKAKNLNLTVDEYIEKLIKKECE